MRDRIVHVFGDHLDGRAEGMTGPERALHRIDRIGQLLFEAIEALLAVARDLDER